jgi:tRNA(Arg) A34 adenosine deaminase TadA
MSDEKFMRLAIEKAKDGIKHGQTPFGACIVKNNEVISCAHNTVWNNMDITAHAEMNAIRMACRKLNTINLEGCVIYSTCEPCLMCFGACHWARISRIVYGARIEDAKKFGFNELVSPKYRVESLRKHNMEVIGDFLRDECLKLFEMWSNRKDKKPY